MKRVSKSNPALEQIKEKVDVAVALEKKIERLDDAVKYLAAEIGHMDIRINYANNDEICLARIFDAKTTHDMFREVILAKLIEYQNNLTTQYNEIKF